MSYKSAGARQKEGRLRYGSSVENEQSGATRIDEYRGYKIYKEGYSKYSYEHDSRRFDTVDKVKRAIDDQLKDLSEDGEK